MEPSTPSGGHGLHRMGSLGKGKRRGPKEAIRKMSLKVVYGAIKPWDGTKQKMVKTT